MRAAHAASALQVQEELFTRARAHASQLEGMLSSDAMMRKPHSELEAMLDGAGKNGPG